MNETICSNYATPKEVYKKQCEDKRNAKMKEIQKLKAKLANLTPESAAYKECEKALIKAEAKLKEYIQSIYIMNVQINAQTYPQFRGLPLIVTISGR